MKTVSFLENLEFSIMCPKHLMCISVDIHCTNDEHLYLFIHLKEKNQHLANLTEYTKTMVNSILKITITVLTVVQGATNPGKTTLGLCVVYKVRTRVPVVPCNRECNCSAHKAWPLERVTVEDSFLFVCLLVVVVFFFLILCGRI